MPTTRDRGKEEQEIGIQEAFWSFYTVENLNLLVCQFLRQKKMIKVCKVSALYYGPRYNNFHAKCTAISVLCFCFFSKSGGWNNAKYGFQYTFNNMQKWRRRKERTTYGPLQRHSQLITHPVLNPDRQGFTWVLLPNRVLPGLLRDTYF